MRYLENYTAEFNQYYYKVGHNETNLGMFYDKLSYPINSIINEKYMAWLERTDVVDTLREFLIYENGSMNNVLIYKSKRRLRSSSSLAGIHRTNGEKNLKKEEKENSIRKRVLTSKEVRNIK